MKPIKLKTALTASILLLFIIFISGCSQKNEITNDVPSVKVMELKKTSLTVTVDYPAKLLPSQDINVSARIPGKVAGVNFDVGSKVKKGDILFTLEAEESNSQLSQSKAALSSTKENIKRQLLDAQTALDQAQLQYDNSKSTYEKTEELYRQGAASKQDRDNVENLYKNAAVSLEAAKKNLEILKGSGSGGLASAQTNQAQSVVDTASIQVENSIIRAPIDGTVSVCNVKAGELTSSAINAFTIINSDDLSAEISVPGEVQSVLSIGQVLRFKVGVNGEKELDGTIDTISPAADPGTGFYSVKLVVKNGDGSLKPGVFAKAVVPTISRNGVMTVPGGAIVSENGIEFVYVMQDGIVVKKIVRTGASTDTSTEISGDLKEGDKIILEGQSFLSEGEKVEAVRGDNV